MATAGFGCRVALTVGAGWMREESELLGQSFGNRGRRLNEMIPARRACLDPTDVTSFRGPSERFAERLLR